MHFLHLFLVALWMEVSGSGQGEFCYYSVKEGEFQSSKPCESKADIVWEELRRRTQPRFQASNPSGCNRTLIASKNSKVLQSHPRFNSHNYPLNRNCKWTIKSHGGKIYLGFVTFQLEDSAGCDKDFVTIQSSVQKNSTKPEVEKRRYCGIKGPSTAMYSSGHIFIRFHSDNSTREKGFLAIFRSYPLHADHPSNIPFR